VRERKMRERKSVKQTSPNELDTTNWTPTPDSASKAQVPLNSEIVFKEQFLLVKRF